MTAGLLSYITLVSKKGREHDYLDMPIKFAKIPSFERLHELLIYNPETGELKWRINRGSVRSGDLAGCIHVNKYGRKDYRIRIDGTMYFSSRIIWALYYRIDPGSLTIDHVNRDPLDNRISNLRLATAHEQALNMSITSPSTATRYTGLVMQSHENDRRQRPQWHGKIRVADHYYYFGSVTVDTINDEPPRWLIDRAAKLYALRDNPSITDAALIDEIKGLKRVPLSV